MNADRKLLEEIRVQLEECLQKLPGTGAPAGITEHLDSAVRRLNSFLEMIDNWDRGNGS